MNSPFSIDLDFQGPYSVTENQDRQTADLQYKDKPLRMAIPELGGPKLARPKLQFQGGTPAQREARIVDDSHKAGNRALEFVVREPNVYQGGKAGVKSRVQMNVYGNSGVAELRQSVRMRLAPEMAELTQFPEPFSWFTIAEFWNEAGWLGKPHPFRISVSLTSAGPSSGLRLSVRATGKPDGSKKYSMQVWQARSDFVVPVAQWVRLEYYYREGNADGGRFVLRAAVGEVEPITVVDVTNYTHHPENTAPDGLKHFNPLKLYTSAAITEHVRQRGGALAVQWDDLSLQAWGKYPNAVGSRERPL